MRGVKVRGVRYKVAVIGPKFAVATAIFIALSLSGCGPTYPGKNVKESIVKICKEEYNVDVKVETAGKTLAIYLPLTDLMDFTFALTKSASEKINNVIFTAARVALSTDAKFDFYCVIAHDIRMPELQIIIIKSVEDVKRLFANDISRGEYLKRMLIDLRWSPQAKKEQAIKDVFNKMNLDPKWQDQVLNDFFRTTPTGVADIGYWNNHFYIKDISTAEFLAEQIANRIRMEFRSEKNLVDSFILKSSKGVYLERGGKHLFRFEVMAEHGGFALDATSSDRNTVFDTVVGIANHVLHGYLFTDFDLIEVVDLSDSRVLSVSKEELDQLRTKKITFDDILTKDIN